MILSLSAVSRMLKYRPWPRSDQRPAGIRFPKLSSGSNRLLLAALGILLVLAMTGCTGRSLITWGESGGDGWTVTAADDSKLYIGTRQGQVLAVDGVTGDSVPRVVWGYDLEDKHGVFGKPAVGQDHIYVGDKGDLEGRNGRVLALLKDRVLVSNTGGRANLLQEGEWDFVIEGGIVGGPVLTEDESLALVASDDGGLYAFNTTGDSRNRQAWSFFAEGQVWSTPVVSGGVVYFGSLDRHIYALAVGKELSPGESRLLWKYETGGAVIGGPLVVDGPLGKMVVVGSLDQNLYALGAASGELLWSYQGGDWFWAGPVGDEAYIYAATMSSTVHALDKRGLPVWEHELEGGSPVVSRPVVFDGDLVVATDEGKLFLLDATSGDRIGGFQDLDGRVKAPLSNLDGMVFVGVEDNSVRGVNLDDWRESWNFSTKDR